MKLKNTKKTTASKSDKPIEVSKSNLDVAAVSVVEEEAVKVEQPTETAHKPNEQESKKTTEQEPSNGEETVVADAEEQEQALNLNIGECLYTARIAKRWNRAVTGEKLGLTETAIKKLEDNDYGFFPNNVYVRGYIRNYSKKVDLNSEEMVALFDKYCLENNLYSGKSSLNQAPQIAPRSNNKPMLLIVFAAVAAVAAMVLIYMFL